MPLTRTDADFWWLRYFCGLALPVGFMALGIYSLISLHSYSPFDARHRGIYFVSVYGRQAVAMGVAYLGLAVTLFGNCYAQYHDTMAYYYQWIAAPGALMFILGIAWCCWIQLTG
jgi:hypothetical protein